MDGGGSSCSQKVDAERRRHIFTTLFTHGKPTANHHQSKKNMMIGIGGIITK